MSQLSKNKQIRNKTLAEAGAALFTYKFPEPTSIPADVLAELEKHSKPEVAIASAESARVVMLSILASMMEK